MLEPEFYLAHTDKQRQDTTKFACISIDCFSVQQILHQEQQRNGPRGVEG